MYINRFDDQVDEMKQKFIEEGNYANATRIYNVPDSLSGICKAHSAALFKVGYKNIGTLAILMENPYWYEKVPGIGFETSKKLTAAMCREGFIDRSSETCKRVFTNKINPLMKGKSLCETNRS